MNDTEESATPRPPRGARNFPAVGMVKWACWCGEVARVAGDLGTDTGWTFVRNHRDEHREAAKRVRKS